jgi:hypothetical protein
MEPINDFAIDAETEIGLQLGDDEVENARFEN